MSKFKILGYQLNWNWKLKKGYIRMKIDNVENVKKFKFSNPQNYDIVSSMLSNESIVYFNPENNWFYTEPDKVGHDEEE